MKFAIFTIPVAVAASFAQPANAAFFNNSMGLSSPDQIVTFESATLVQNQSVSNEFQSFGVTFTNAFANPELASPPNIAGNRLGNFQAGVPVGGVFVVKFTDVLSGAAFAFGSQPGTATFTAMLNGAVVATESAATKFDLTDNFYGFQGISFNSISIMVESSDDTFLLDNLQTVSAVPEPQAWALLIAGFAVLGALVRRRQF